MSFVELINASEAVIGAVLEGEVLRVGHDSYSVGHVNRIEVTSHVVRGATEPLLRIYGSTGTMVPNWESVVGVILAPETAEETLEPAPLESDSI